MAKANPCIQCSEPDTATFSDADDLGICMFCWECGADADPGLSEDDAIEKWNAENPKEQRDEQ